MTTLQETQRGPLLAALLARSDTIARQWASAIAQTGFSWLAATEVRQRLVGLTEQASRLLCGEPFACEAARAIGATIAELRYLEPEALGQTQAVLGRELATSLPADDLSVWYPRLTLMLSELAIGFTQRARLMMLDEQEAIRGALLSQRAQAVQALVLQFAAVQQARDELRAVLDATDDAMLLLGPDRRALTVNRRFEELFGLPAATLLGHTIGDLQDELARIFVDPHALRQVFDRVAGSGDEVTVTVEQRWPRERALQLFSTPVRRADGSLLGRLHVFRDVTREREANRLKTEFVSLVSHELRTPMTSIKGYVDLLLEEAAGPVTVDQREFLEIVKSNADRLVALISDLLDLSRIEAGKMDLHCAPVPLEPLLTKVVTSFRPQLEARQQSITLHLPTNLPPVMGDGDRLIQVFTNLVSNATKYTPDRGRIRLWARPHLGQIRVNVSDTGIGMSADERRQLFTKFFRATNRMARDVGGTGLGLAITRSLVELHGGQIRVASTPGKGTTFTVCLPAGQSTPAVAVPVAAPAQHRASGGSLMVSQPA